MGQNIVAWRDELGEVCVANAICPHLGANLSPEFGGVLIQGELVCPFHGLRYNSDGVCVRLQDGLPKRRIELTVFPVLEINNLIFAYWHPRGDSPDWRIPELPQEGWSSYVYDSKRVQTHPQETAENAPDYQHLSQVHGYFRVKGVEKASIDGPLFENGFLMSRRIRFGPLTQVFDLDISVTLWGLGYFLVEIKSERVGITVRQLSLNTPVDEKQTNYVMVVQVSHLDHPNQLIPGLNLLPRSLVRRIARHIVFRIYRHDIAQDFRMWEHKQYLPHPRLTHVDGPILQFRSWCEQFYGDSENSLPERTIATTTVPESSSSEKT